MELYDYIKPNPIPPPPLFTELGHSYQDRYQFHTPDSGLWLELFWLADAVDRTLAEKLEYIRAVGALLIPDPQHGFRVQPIINAETGWYPYCGRVNPTTDNPVCDNCQYKCYDRERQYLVPHIKTMLRVLQELKQRHNSGKSF